ncbi:MAG: hypothetical protein U0T82_15735 [Bacteroidales bacterium]
MALSVYKMLNIEKEESSRVFLFLIQSVFIGLFYGALDVAAHALFLDVYPATFIPKAYIVSGVVGILFTSLYTRLQVRMKFSLFAAFNLLSIALLSFVIWSGFLFVKDKIIVFVLFIFFGPLNILAGLGFWGGVGRMFTLRQGKRIFGLIDSGQIIGIILSSYGATLILSIGYKTRDLLLISAASIFAGMLLQLIINRRFGFPAQVQETDTKEDRRENSFLTMIRNRYVLFLSLFVGFSVAATFFVHYTFVTVTKENYPDTTSLAKFLGAFTGTMMIVSLLVKTFVYGRLIKTYGLKVILALSPLLLGLFTLASILLGQLGGFTAASSGFMLFFLIVSLTKLFSKILRDSIEAPSFKVLYQSLGSNIRYSVQAGVDGTINEISAFGSGLALAGLVSLPFVTTIHFVYILGLILILWAFTAFRLHREYRNSLQSSLAAYDRKGFRSEIFSLPAFLTELYEKGSNVSKSFVLSLTTRISPALHEKLTGKSEPARYTDEPSVLVYSPDPVHRVSCAFYLRGQSGSDKIRFLRILLRDNDTTVRKAAIQTAGQDRVIELAPFIIEQLAHPSVYPWAYQALLAMGEPVLEPLEVFFKKTGLEEKVLLRIIRLMADIGGSASSRFLLSKLGSFNRNLVKETISALRRLKPSLAPEQERLVNKVLQDFLALLAWNTAARASLIEGERLVLLKSALEEEAHQLYETAMNLLALLYDEKSVMLVKENLESGTREGIGYALELLDLFISDELKHLLFPLLEDNNLNEKLRLLQEEYPVEKYHTWSLLKTIINKSNNEVGPATRLMAIHSIAQLKNPAASEDLIAQLFNENKALAETAALTLASIDADVLENVFSRLNQAGNSELKDRFLRISKDKLQASIISLMVALRKCDELRNLDWNQLLKLASGMNDYICSNDNRSTLENLLITRKNLVVVVRGNYEETSGEEKLSFKAGAVLMPLQNSKIVTGNPALEDNSLLAILAEEDLAEMLFDEPFLAQIFAVKEPTPETSNIPS